MDLWIGAFVFIVCCCVLVWFAVSGLPSYVDYLKQEDSGEDVERGAVEMDTHRN